MSDDRGKMFSSLEGCDQSLGQPSTSGDPTQEFTGSEIVSREIVQVPFTHLLTTGEHRQIVTNLAQLITSWSNYFIRPLILHALIQACK